MKRHYIFTLALLAFVSQVLMAQNQIQKGKSDSAKKGISTDPIINTKEELQAKYFIEELRFKEDGSIHTILGNIRISNATGDLERDAISFLNEIAPLYGYKDITTEFRVHAKYSDMIVFHQYFNGVPVLNGSINLYTWEPGVINNVLGNYVRGVNINASPTIDSVVVEEIVRADAENEEAELTFSNKKLWIMEHDGGFHLVWSLRAFRSTSIIGFEYDVDAHTGVVLRKSSLEVH